MKYLYSWFDKRNSKPAPRFYGKSYSEFDRALDVYYPIPLNYIIRYWLDFYWGFIKLCWWIGIVDTEEAREFGWGDFWRIDRSKQYNYKS